MLSSYIKDSCFLLQSSGLFNNILSVIDMGDQDFEISVKEYEEKTKIYNIKKNSDLVKLIKKYEINKGEPMISSSFFWKSIGIKNTARIDLTFKTRFEEDNFAKCVEQDLNYPLVNNLDLKNNFSLVTDFGNNEHPFNVMQTFKTMHELCKKDGIIWSAQSVINGNGFYNFNTCFYENLAAFNNYSIVYSYFVYISEDGKKYFTSPTDTQYLKYINHNIINNVMIVYIFRKNDEKEFSIPYQGLGKDGKRQNLYFVDFKGTTIPLSQTYIPTDIGAFNYKIILLEVFKRIWGKLNKIFNKHR